MFCAEESKLFSDNQGVIHELNLKSIISTPYMETFFALYNKLSAHIWESGNRKLHYENVLAQWSRLVQEYLTTNAIMELP
jgi:hypothetical protein